jgi:SAM-dependent methyltransferase
MNCPICSGETRRQFSTKFTVVGKCANKDCGHLYALEAPIGTGVHEHARSVVDFYAARNQVLVDRLITIGLVGPKFRVLDIGSGLGHIMSAVRQRLPDTRITCVEAARNSIDYLHKQHFTVIEDFALLPGTGPYDVIFMVEVIEHLDDPSTTLSLCRSLLASNGKVFLTTPCGELRSGSHGTAAYDTPEHIQFFTPRSLRFAASRAGFERVEFYQMREFYSGSTNRTIKAIKDSLRIARNWLQGRHHLVAILSR